MNRFQTGSMGRVILFCRCHWKFHRIALATAHMLSIALSRNKRFVRNRDNVKKCLTTVRASRISIFKAAGNGSAKTSRCWTKPQRTSSKCSNRAWKMSSRCSSVRSGFSFLMFSRSTSHLFMNTIRLYVLNWPTTDRQSLIASTKAGPLIETSTM
jgi:hypothetical protein